MAGLLDDLDDVSDIRAQSGARGGRNRLHRRRKAGRRSRLRPAQVSIQVEDQVAIDRREEGRNRLVVSSAHRVHSIYA